MSVASIPQNLLGAVGSAVAVSSTAATSTAGSTNSASSLTGTAGAQARSILAGYNLEEISPSELSTMIQQLQQAGAVSAADFADLTQLRTELDAGGVQADEPVDLLDYLNNKLSTQKKQLNTAVQKSPNGAVGVNADAYLGQTMRQLTLVQKFSSIQGPTETEPLDAVA